MIHPSYTELIDAINTNNEEDARSQVLNSRYSLVLATSKRARQLIAGADPLVENAAGKKPLAIAIDELYKGRVKILAEKEEELSLEELNGENPDEIGETYADEAAETEDPDADGAVGSGSAETDIAADAEGNETAETADTDAEAADAEDDTVDSAEAADTED